MRATCDDRPELHAMAIDGVAPVPRRYRRHAEPRRGLAVPGAGRFLERANDHGLDARAVRRGHGDRPASVRPTTWRWRRACCALCAALEAYCRHYTADIRPSGSPSFCCSTRSSRGPCVLRPTASKTHCARSREAGPLGRRPSRAIRRPAARGAQLRPSDEILKTIVTPYRRTPRKAVRADPRAINQTYITYPIETAIAR